MSTAFTSSSFLITPGSDAIRSVMFPLLYCVPPMDFSRKRLFCAWLLCSRHDGLASGVYYIFHNQWSDFIGAQSDIFVYAFITMTYKLSQNFILTISMAWQCQVGIHGIFAWFRTLHHTWWKLLQENAWGKKCKYLVSLNKLCVRYVEQSKGMSTSSNWTGYQWS